MASRTILRKSSFVHQYVNGSTCHSLECAIATTSPPSKHFNTDEGKSLCKGELFNLSGLGIYIPRFTRSAGSLNGFSGLNEPLGVRWLMSHSAAVAAKQPEQDNEGNDENLVAKKKRKEVSPEECDQAVEGMRMQNGE